MRTRSRPAVSGRPWGKWLVIAVGSLLLLGLLGALSLRRDAILLEASLLRAQVTAREAVDATVAGDLQLAAARIDEARTTLEEGRVRTSSVTWDVAELIPGAGNTVETVRGVLDVSDAGLVLARHAIDGGGELLTGDGRLPVTIEDQQVDLDPLLDARLVLDELPLDRLQETASQLDDVPDDLVPGTLLEGKQRALAMARRAEEQVTSGRRLLAFLPGLLGVDEPRRFVLVLQTNAEVRGTGGLLKYFALLDIDDGRFTLGPPIVYQELRTDASGKQVPVPGLGDQGDATDFPEGFVDRYGHLLAGRIFANLNVDPDLPTTGRVLVDLYERRTGNDVDGAILLDMVGMETVLRGVGPIAVPQAARPVAGLPRQIRPDAIADWTMVRVYDHVGAEHAEARRQFLQGFGEAAFARLFSGEWDGLAMAQRVAEAVSERHLQIYSQDPDEQARLVDAGIAGVFGAPVGSDLLAVTANNAVGGKMDVHLGYEFHGEFGLRLAEETGSSEDVRQGGRFGSLRTTVTNPLPSSGMDLYVIGSCAISRDNRECFEGPTGQNLTWFTVWGNDGTVFGDAVSGGEALDHQSIGSIHGHEAYDAFLRTDPESQNWFEVDVGSPVTFRVEGDELVYRMHWWRQARAVPDHLDLTFRAPEGYEAIAATAEGGSDGAGMGTLGEAQQLRTIVSGDAARVTGSVTADLDVEIRFARR